MLVVFKNSCYFDGKNYINSEFAFNNGTFISDMQKIKSSQEYNGAVFFNNCMMFPGFCDVHVHFREPGYLHKEDISTGTYAAAHGGYTDVFTMPNLNPVPDNYENLKIQLDAIEKKAVINVYPYGSLTKEQKGEQLSSLEEMSDFVIALSDDGRGVQSGEIMRECMKKSKELGKIVVAHCEDNSLLFGGYIHDGKYAKIHNHKGICSESEWGPIKRDLQLCKETGASYHVCHISTKESVELIRQAKADGIDVTCETAPHYLVLDEMDLQEDGRFKMNPPIRSAEDKQALITGLIDGTIDMIATDHAPHSYDEKNKGLEKSFMGVVGIETAFPILYTELVKKGVITLEKLIELLVLNPRERFGVKSEDNYCVWNLEEKYVVDPAQFKSKGRSTPFEGREVYGKCLLTVCGGNVAYSNFENKD